jgi:hypothetical protein
MEKQLSLNFVYVSVREELIDKSEVILTQKNRLPLVAEVLGITTPRHPANTPIPLT